MKEGHRENKENRGGISVGICLAVYVRAGEIISHPSRLCRKGRRITLSAVRDRFLPSLTGCATLIPVQEHAAPGRQAISPIWLGTNDG